MKPTTLGTALRRFCIGYVPVYVMGAGFIMPHGDISMAAIIEYSGILGLLIGVVMVCLRKLRRWAFTWGVSLAALIHLTFLYLAWTAYSH